MKIFFALLLSLSLLINSPVFAKPFKSLNTSIFETRTMKTLITKGKEESFREEDKLPSIQELIIKKISKDEKDYYKIICKQELFNKQSIERISLIEIGEFFKSTSFSRIKKNPDGKEIEKYHVNLSDPCWEYPEDTFSIDAPDLIFRILIEQNIEEYDFHLRESDDMMIRMKVKIMGKEDIQVPLGNYKCYKILMEPDIKSVLPLPNFIAFIIQPLVPECYYWFSEKEPYPLIKYDGPTGPLGSSREINEIIDYSILQQ